MKIKFVILIVLFFTLTLNKNIMAQEINTSLFDKLTGKWIIQYEKGEMTETWEKISDTEYKGLSQLTQEGKIVFEEIMSLTKEDDGKYYFNALIKERKIKLEVIKAEDNELLYEGESDKNRVSYKFEDEKLHVRIIRKEDNTVKEEFLFERAK